MIDFWQPHKEWVQYENDTFEPVNRTENINKKPRNENDLDWWVVRKKPDWEPDTFADSKRGKKAKKEYQQTLNSRPEDNDQFERDISQYGFGVDTLFRPLRGKKQMRERLHDEKDNHVDENDWEIRQELDREADNYGYGDAFIDTYRFRNDDRAFAHYRDRAKKRIGKNKR